MKLWFFLFPCILLFLGCEDTKTYPSWIDETIAKHKAEGAQTSAMIFECMYKDKKVYYVDLCVACPDYQTTLYDTEKKVVCKFGGITGQITCPDFDCTGKETIIYEYTIKRN